MIQVPRNQFKLLRCRLCSLLTLSVLLVLSHGGTKMESQENRSGRSTKKRATTMHRFQQHGKRQGPRTALGERDPPKQRLSSQSEAALTRRDWICPFHTQARCRGRGTLRDRRWATGRSCWSLLVLFASGTRFRYGP
ncbi:hypothetical protein B0T09DRAFT_342599 [Sordaria sp. MPI-SDFR-AT-0083]|nr:hypothetical protein B0T09DRAFT_342599 [Sordaria sp. MPI-SDFR-AT-0083]